MLTFGLWRGDRATEQWFANLDRIKDDAQAALKHVDFHPAICACN
jgi:isoleucyl-tRNA synthetase